MGSHAGCSSATCNLFAVVLHADANPLGDVAESAGSSELRLPFQVGINQIELGTHGSQDYRFLPEVRQIQHDFIDVSGDVELSQVRASARLNPTQGQSRTEFNAVEESQDGFFPAHQGLELYLKLSLEFSSDLHIDRPSISMINKDPMRFHTVRPLTGFPPLYGPAFSLESAVDFYDEENLESRPLMTVVENAIVPQARLLYDVTSHLLSVGDDGSFEGVSTISTIGVNDPVPTIVRLLPTRGVELTSADSLQLSIAPGARSSVRVSGRIFDRTEPHLSVNIRPYSLDPNVPGGGRVEMPLDFISHPIADSKSLEVLELPPQAVQAGERFGLTVVPVSSGRLGEAEVIWVPADGMRVERVNGVSAEFIAPDVPYVTEAWVNVYVREGELVSRPHKLEVRIYPRTG